jgi:hypothetical protein
MLESIIKRKEKGLAHQKQVREEQVIDCCRVSSSRHALGNPVVFVREQPSENGNIAVNVTFRRALHASRVTDGR